MAYDKVIDSVQLETAITATADAIREKLGVTSQLEWRENYGFAKDVGVIGADPKLQDKTITENGTYTADEGYDGLETVTVNVPSSGGSGGILIGGELLLDESVTTAPDHYGCPVYESGITALSSLNVGDVVAVNYDNTNYVVKCMSDETSFGDAKYIGNVSIYGSKMLEFMANNMGQTPEDIIASDPSWNSILVDTGEPFFVLFATDYSVFYTTTEGAHRFVISLLASGGGSAPKLQDKTITENGIYSADEGYDGLGTVTVEVASSGGVFEDGFSVNFHNLNNDLIATSSAKFGTYVAELPNHDYDGWKDSNGNIFENFPFTSAEMVTLNLFAFMKEVNLVNDLYTAFGVDQSVYPYVCVLIKPDVNNNMSGLMFGRTYSTYGSTGLTMNGYVSNPGGTFVSSYTEETYTNPVALVNFVINNKSQYSMDEEEWSNSTKGYVMFTNFDVSSVNNADSTDVTWKYRLDA